MATQRHHGGTHAMRQSHRRRGPVSTRVAAIALALVAFLYFGRGDSPSPPPADTAARPGPARVRRFSGDLPPVVPTDEDHGELAGPVIGMASSEPEDQLTFLLTSCEPDPRVLSLPERRLLPAEAKQSIGDVLERSRLRSRAAVSERYMAMFGRAAPARASTAELAAELWRALPAADRARAAAAVGGVVPPGSAPPLGLDALVAALASEPERTFDELEVAIGAEAAARIWGAETVSWCAFALPL
jgi:hypothetical protein